MAFLLGLALGADSAAGIVAGLGAVGGCMGASELNIWLMLADAGAGGCATAVTKGVVAAAGARLLFNKQGHQLELNLLVCIQAFLDVFPQLSPTQVGETLSSSKKSLSFS